MPVKNTILLVDDDPDDRMLFMEALEGLNSDHEVVELKNAVELLNWLDKQNPQIPRMIVMDYHMEMMNGEEALKAIKKNKLYSKIPVIVYSGSSQSYKLEPVLKWGANAYVQKPSSYDETVEVVKSIVLLFG